MPCQVGTVELLSFLMLVFLHVCLFFVSVFGAFAKLRKATVSIVSVCASAWNNSTPTGRILMKFDIQAFFSKICSQNSSFTKIRQE
jgi:hypothetical protein